MGRVYRSQDSQYITEMGKVIEPLKEDKKLIQHFDKDIQKVGLVFYHGLGDLIMFLNPFYALKEQYPDIEFTLILQDGLSFADICPDAYFLKPGDMENLDKLPYDLVAKIHFPMNEGQIEYTKGEWCCIHELGIAPVSGHRKLAKAPNRLVAVHYQITCLPDAANPDAETAEKIWNEILEAGYIPTESHFKHVFHNPVNDKFPFIDCTVRRVKPQISTLVGLLQNCAAFVGVVSGPFHTALATLPPERIFFLEKHFKKECFTHLPVARASIMPGEYKHEVKEWLQNLPI